MIDHLYNDQIGSWHSTMYRHKDGSCTQSTGWDGARNVGLRSNTQQQSIKDPTEANRGADQRGKVFEKATKRKNGLKGAYHGHSLHAEDQGVRGHVPGIRQCILLPELPEQILS